VRGEGVLYPTEILAGTQTDELEENVFPHPQMQMPSVTATLEGEALQISERGVAPFEFERHGNRLVEP